MLSKLRILLLAALLPMAAAAQDAASDPEAPEIRRYTVEIIVFRYAENVAVGNEVFLPDVPAAEPADDSLDLLDEAVEPIEVPDDEPVPLPDTEFTLLTEADFQLNDVHRKLVLLDAYEPLMHFGWTQATWPQDVTDAIPLSRFARPPAGLDGTLTLYLSRYLHLVVDLALHDPSSPRASLQSADNYGFDDPVRPADLPVYFRIEEDSILRTGELRYFDHPKFGVIARVARVEEAEEPDDGELLGYPLQ